MYMYLPINPFGGKHLLQNSVQFCARQRAHVRGECGVNNVIDTWLQWNENIISIVLKLTTREDEMSMCTSLKYLFITSWWSLNSDLLWKDLRTMIYNFKRYTKNKNRWTLMILWIFIFSSQTLMSHASSNVLWGWHDLYIRHRFSFHI